MNKTIAKALYVLGTFFLFGIVAAHAATITVDSTADAGAGTLRQALIDATANGASNDIVFAIPRTDPGLDTVKNRFTIALSSELPMLPAVPTTITNGQDEAITVKGNDSFRIFTLPNSAVVIITNLTISNGWTGNLPFSGKVSRAYNQLGSIGYGQGGAIYVSNSGTLTLNDCTISNNHAMDFGGGIHVNNSGTLHIHRTTFDGNNATYGGAFFIYVSATVNMDKSTFTGNRALEGGGAIYVESAGTLNASSNTFDGNSADYYGGAIVNQATMTLTSNTITRNSAASQAGGIYNGSTATLNNNIVADNTAQYGPDLIGDGSDWGIAFVGSYNLIGNTDYSSGLIGGTNIGGVTGSELDPMLGPLAANGGPTLTRLPQNGSPAIDKGNSPLDSADQRAWARPWDNLVVSNTGDGSDIGAVETQLSPSAGSVSVAGRIRSTSKDRGVSNAVITMTSGGSESWTTRSNGFGYYEFPSVPAGDTYIVTVSHKSFTFNALAINALEDLANCDFTANP